MEQRYEYSWSMNRWINKKPHLIFQTGLPLLLNHSHITKIPHPHLNRVFELIENVFNDNIDDRSLKYLSPRSSHHQLFSSHTQAVNLEDEMVNNELKKAC